jgi:hypothetical protein
MLGDSPYVSFIIPDVIDEIKNQWKALPKIPAGMDEMLNEKLTAAKTWMAEFLNPTPTKPPSVSEMSAGKP